MRIHKPEGALFLWLWFEGLPISSRELSPKPEENGSFGGFRTLFFPWHGRDDWSHKDQCIRVTYAQEDMVVERGISLIAEEIRQLYS